MLQRGADYCVESSALREQSSYALNLSADGHAAPAKNALARIAHETRCRGIELAAMRLARKSHLPYAKLARHRLKLAVVAPCARLAIAVVLGEKELEHRPAGLPHSLGIGPDDHAFAHGRHTRGRERARAFYLDQAHAACAYGLHFFEAAKGRYVDAGHAGRVENGGSTRYVGHYAVDGHSGHLLSPFPG
jgi:hypothetical protein